MQLEGLLASQVLVYMASWSEAVGNLHHKFVCLQWESLLAFVDTLVVLPDKGPGIPDDIQSGNSQ